MDSLGLFVAPLTQAGIARAVKLIQECQEAGVTLHPDDGMVFPRGKLSGDLAARCRGAKRELYAVLTGEHLLPWYRRRVSILDGREGWLEAVMSTAHVSLDGATRVTTFPLWQVHTIGAK